MANSVTETIENIVETEGSITKEKAKNYIIELQVYEIYIYFIHQKLQFSKLKGSTQIP